MEISKRLGKAAEYISCDIMADIGTDHGYLPIYLLQSGRIKKCIASDVNKGPLARCAENAERSGLSPLIETRLGNGLSCIAENEVNTVSICGMGGILMTKLLSDGANVAKSCESIVLQPQTHWLSIRKAVHSIDFSIAKEEIIFEDGMFYTVMKCVPGKEEYSDMEYLFGKQNLSARSGTFLYYIMSELEKSKRAVSQIKRSASSDASRQKESELLRYIAYLEDCLSGKGRENLYSGGNNDSI